MLSRTGLRASRTLRTRRSPLQATRFQSTTTTGSAPAGGLSHGVIGGLIGGGATLGAVYLWYHLSGLKTAVNYSKSVKGYVDHYTNQVKKSVPDSSNEALDWIRGQATAYAAFVPGGKGVVNSAFDDIDTIRQKHGDEVDKIVKEAYDELKSASKDGLSLTTATKAWTILQDKFGRIFELAGDSISEIIDNHPQLKEKVGPQLDTLKGMGESYGPKAKEMVDETWKQVSDIAKGGFSVASIDKIRKLVEEKSEQVRKIGQQAYEKALEEAQGQLEKAPKVKEFVEKNKDSLMQGNVKETFEKVKNAVSKGDTSDLEKYAKGLGDKAKKSGLFDMIPEKYLNMVPGGGEILPQLYKFKDIAEAHGDEAQKLIKETVAEVKKVLESKTEEAKKLGDKVKEDAKKETKKD